ncbi:MAG: hypothetical protein EHM21_05810 [Chloroflexi bacterium]|nr:MAG: hypothetical protein EHM21_05810 [Chloroflexota bacterium]
MLAPSPTLLPTAQPTQTAAAEACLVTQPALATPPEDSAVMNEPAPGYYYLNEDHSIWASAWGPPEEVKYSLKENENGFKFGWFRPAGAPLEITGRRLDGEAPPLDAHVPCCYPTRFQATGLVFPSAGCWEISAKAGGSSLTFVIKIEP